MVIDQHKLNRQVEVINRWIENNYKGTLLACTGFGKSFTAFLAIRKIRRELNNVYPKTLVVVPTLYLKDQWTAMLLQHEVENVTVMVINSVITSGKNEVIDVQLLILDECHKFVAEEFGLVYDLVKYERILALTATLDRSDKRFDVIREHCPIIDTITLKEAVENKWVSEFINYALPVTMTAEEQIAYDEVNEKCKKYMSTFEGDFALINEIANDGTKKKAALYASKIKWSTDAVFISALQARKLINQRKHLIYGSINKVNATVDIVMKYHKTRKILVFSQNTKFVDLVAEKLNALGVSCGTYHSNMNTVVVHKTTSRVVAHKEGAKYRLVSEDKLVTWDYFSSSIYKRISGDKIKKQIVEDYKNDDIRVLASAIALDQGMDIPVADFAIIASGSSKEIQSIQRKGRVIRFLENKQAVIVELYLKDTQDRKWLDKRVSDGNILYVETIAEIAA